MNRTDISKALRGSSGERAFITATQLTRALGRSDSYKVKKEYLEGLEHVNGRYLISDVADVIKKKARM